MPRCEFAPGLDSVGRHVRPPSREIRMRGLVEHAVPGPRWMYTVAMRLGSLGWVATTGSHDRSATDRGTELTRRSNSTRGVDAVAGSGVGVSVGVGSEVGDTSGRAVARGRCERPADPPGVGCGAPVATPAPESAAHPSRMTTATVTTAPRHDGPFTAQEPYGSLRRDRSPGSRRMSQSNGDGPCTRSAGR